MNLHQIPSPRIAVLHEPTYTPRLQDPELARL
jgi:hypothetical protein